MSVLDRYRSLLSLVSSFLLDGCAMRPPVFVLRVLLLGARLPRFPSIVRSSYVMDCRVLSFLASLCLVASS